MKTLTCKQIAQTYFLNDIILHELIIESISNVEERLKVSKKPKFTRFDLVHIIRKDIEDNELYNIFELSTDDILNVIKNEYQEELTDLVDKYSSSKEVYGI